MARLAGALRNEVEREPRASLSAQAVDMARRLGDPATLAYALDGRYSAIWAPDTIAERSDIADEIIRLAEQIGDDERAFQGHHYRLWVQMETGDLPAMKHELEANARAAEALHQPAQQWYVAATIVVLALFEGRLAEAEELIDRAYDHGRRAESMYALGIRRFQEYALRREQGRAAEMEPALVDLARDYWYWPWVRAVLAHLQAELGRKSAARREFDACAAADFRDWPLDNDWLLGLTLFADVCTFLGDRHQAATLYALLSPYEDRNAIGHPELSTGSVARSLANLASTTGRFEDAERHFAVALEMNVRMGARPWVAHTRFDLAQMLLERDQPTDRERAIEELHQAAELAAALGQVALQRKAASVLARLGETGPEAAATSAPRPAHIGVTALNVFRREGDYWVVAFGGHESRLHDAKGLSYLAALLANPGREIHALDLASSKGPTPRAAVRDESELEGRRGRDDTGPVLDDRARRAYRERIEQLQADIDEAKNWNDPERAARAQEELEFLVRELAAATGLGGRDRRMGSDMERARVNVTRAIRSAMTRIDEHHPELARHLKRTVRTGTFCIYAPDPMGSIDWTL
jgi:tetratricopeptide (TPR) repeat protein